MVKRGLVMPIVNTTNKSASPAVFLRGVFMTGESCEILSKPEKARNEPAKPVKRVAVVNTWPSNILGKSDKKYGKEIWVKTVNRTARSLTKAMTAPTRLTLALSLIPIQFKMPKRMRIPMASHTKIGPMAGTTTLKYKTPERQLRAAVRK